MTLDFGLDKTPFDPDPKTIEATQGLTVTVSGDTVMASSALFTPEMVGTIIYVYNTSNLNFAFYASIKQVAAGGPHTTATLDRTTTISTGLPFWTYGVDNVINNCDVTKALMYDSTKVQPMKSFNNQNTAGALLRAYDTSNGRPLAELADMAQEIVGRLFVLSLTAVIRCDALVLACLLVASPPGTWGQESERGQIVVPNRNRDIPGSQNTDYPFGGFNTFLLQVYDASQFEPLRDGAFLTGVSFRTQEALPAGFNATYDYFEVQLATYKQPLETLPPSYNPDLYEDHTIVFSQNNVRLSGTVSTDPDVPSPFDISLRFDKPFYYDPKAGNLLMYLRSGNVLNATEIRVDVAEYSVDAGYYAIGSISGPKFGAVDAAVVSRFDYTAIPEPSPGRLGLFGLGFLLFFSKYVHSKGAA